MSLRSRRNKNPEKLAVCPTCKQLVDAAELNRGAEKCYGCLDDSWSHDKMKQRR